MSAAHVKHTLLQLVLALFTITAAFHPVQADDTSVLVGRWRMSAPAPDGYPATSVVDLAPNGTFYLTMNQVWYTINITGNYTLSSGTMRFKTANWSPREYGGHPIRPVPAWAMHYRIIDRNRLDTTDSYGNSVISERILSRPKAVGEAPSSY